jgi:Protein of unknown function (DUF2867)
MTVRVSALPTESSLASGYAGADLADAYVIMLPSGTTRDINGLAKEILTHPSAWFRALLRLRDGIVVPLGIKTTSSLLKEAVPEKSISSRSCIGGQLRSSLAKSMSIWISKPRSCSERHYPMAGGS